MGLSPRKPGRDSLIRHHLTCPLPGVHSNLAAISVVKRLKKCCKMFPNAVGFAMAGSYAFGPFRLDISAEILFRGAEPLPIGRRAVALLRTLIENTGVPVSRD